MTRDDAEALKWWRKAAEQGDAKAQFNLGVMYDKGQGVMRNYAEAAKWYRKAAEQGDADAQRNLDLQKQFAEQAGQKVGGSSFLRQLYSVSGSHGFDVSACSIFAVGSGSAVQKSSRPVRR